MKKFLLLYLFLAINSVANSQSGWFTQQSGVNTFLWGISFINPSTGYIASDGGKILMTTNGGINWSIQTLVPSVNVTEVLFVNSQTGYTGGSQGKLFKTTNGGINWNVMTTPTVNSIQSLYFLNENTGLIGGGSVSAGELYRTTNGAANWTQYGQSEFLSTIMGLSFPDSNTGYAACYDGTIKKTANGGVDWISQNSGLTASDPLFSVYFIDDNNGFASSSSGKIIKTTNGGTNWSTVYTSGYAVVDIFFPNLLTGFATGGNFTTEVVFRTINGGSSWVQEILPQSGHANNIFFTSVNEGYITCENGVIYKTTNGGNPIGIHPISENIPSKFELFQNYPNPFNPSTKIKFSVTPPLRTNGAPLPLSGGDVAALAGAVGVKLAIFDVQGRRIATLLNEALKPGSYEIEWDASAYGSGIYFYELRSDEFKAVKKMVLIK